MPLEIGQRLGDYEVLQMLGVGGMGHVYRVRNIISNRTEAMKVLLPDLAAEPDLATRFISEIRTLASFDHPNIAQLHTALIADNQLIMMMEYVEGYTLEQIAKQRTMPVGEVAGYVSQALSALGYAHTHGVVHRDVKPANLMVTSHGIVKLMDFGIAKSQVENNNHTRPGTTMGSLYYMSPEQVRGDTVDARSDIYSVGIVLYELLAGRRPFEADTTFTILNKQLNEQPQPPIELNPGIPAGLNAIILIALAKDPGERFQNADAFRNALKSYCTTPGTQEAAVAPAMSVAAAAVMAANTPVPGSATSFGAENASSAPPLGASAPPLPAYSDIAPSRPGATPGPTLVPPAAKSGKSNKAVWIATGAIAAVLALVAVGVAVPHWMKTHAAGAGSTPTSVTPPADQTPPPSSTADSATPSAAPAPGDAAGQPAAPPPAPADSSATATVAAPQPIATQPTPSHATITPIPGHKPGQDRRQEQPMMAQQGVNAAGSQMAPQQGQTRQDRMQGQEQSEPGPRGGAAAIAEVQERLVDMDARASSAKRQVGQIRRQQEESGLGLRGDVESAESRLDSYLRAAKGDIARGDAASAKQELNKADPELKTLEHFLGH